MIKVWVDEQHWTPTEILALPIDEVVFWAEASGLKIEYTSG